MELEIIEKLEATKAATLEYFALEARDLERCNGPGSWTVREILHHLADAETVLYERIRRVVSEPRQSLISFDQDAWAKELDYSKMPMSLSRNIYSAVRDAVIYNARTHYEDRGHIVFLHSTAGVRTLKQEFDKVAEHNERHLAQIRKALDAH